MTRAVPSLGLRLIAGCAAVLLVLLPAAACAASPSHPTTVPHESAPNLSAPALVAFLGDPQIGYTSLEGDFWRFGQVLRAAEATAANTLIIAGDLTQDHNLVQRWLFAKSLEGLRLPVHVVPGNHDVDDVDSLELFRRQFGPDYSEFVLGELAFLMINSETARSPTLSASEHDKQWGFIERSLHKHQVNGLRTVLVMHRPPFVRQENERETQANWPPESRTRLLDLCRTAGVTLILAGHLHWTNVVQTHDGIQIRVLPGSARSFDRSSIGFELLRLNKTSTDVQFVQVAPPPTPAFSVPGLRGWTPRLFDFSLRHWLFTGLFALSGVCALGAKRRLQSGQVQSAQAAHGSVNSALLFGVVGWMMLFYAVNMQLDLDEFVLETGRILAKQVGVSIIRHWITGSGLFILLGWVLYNVTRAVHAKQPWRDLAAAGACAVPTAWFILSAISHHHLRMLFDELYWDMLNMIAIFVITYAALTARLAPTRQPSRQRPA